MLKQAANKIMSRVMEDWGIRVKYHHHEVGGPGQMEIEVELADMPAHRDPICLSRPPIK